MATGGTIPTNRTQTVTFFDTTGIVDKDKNIYFAPRFSKYAQMSSGKDVRSAYLEIFRSVCPPSSDYADIQISGWSPQDRTLKVRGNIDDFRLVTEEGDCLNYFILSRTITKGNVVKTYYYGFFITGIQQAGGGSVLLTVEPDDFTNVFYLHNQHTLTTEDIENDYEPYNEKIKNAYVNRQHYNRVAYKNVEHNDHYNGSSNVLTVPIGQTINVVSYNVPITHNGNVANESHSVEIVLGNGTYNISYGVFNDAVVYSILNKGDTEFKVILSYSFDIKWTEENAQLVPDNMKVFLNQEETFRYKYQYRDFKRTLNQYLNFTDADYQNIKNASSLSDLSEQLRLKVVYESLYYLVVETRGMEIVSGYSKTKGVSNEKLASGNVINSLRRPNILISYPFINANKFPKFKNELEKITFEHRIAGLDYSTGDNELFSAIKVYTTLNKKAIADYTLGAYITKDNILPISRIELSYNSGLGVYSILFNLDYPDEITTPISRPKLQKGFYLGGISLDKAQDSYIELNDEGGTPYISAGNVCLGIIVSDYNSLEYNIPLRENIPDLKSNYYDNVLEAEPYSFYSISFNSSYEVAFNKNRYYEDIESNLKLVFVSSINSALKIGIIPSYTVDNYETKYFNEGLVFTLSSFLPLISDSYLSYYYQNQAQMKNQFAVADYKYSTDAMQKFFVSSPNQVGQRAFKAGGWGAIAGTINEVAGWIDDAIDYAQDRNIIEMNQKSKLADMGARPDTLKQAGSDIFYDIETNEFDLFLNHYTIDKLSYNSIAKLFERTGYQVNLYTTLNAMDRVGWNFIKLNACDVVGNITVEQESSVRKIFTEGVTLLHDKSYLTSGHNFEIILEGGE